jgi:hypothetical protein
MRYCAYSKLGAKLVPIQMLANGYTLLWLTKDQLEFMGKIMTDLRETSCVIPPAVSTSEVSVTEVGKSSVQLQWILTISNAGNFATTGGYKLQGKSVNELVVGGRSIRKNWRIAIPFLKSPYIEGWPLPGETHSG